MAIPNTFADKTGEVLLGNLDYNFEVLDVRISNNQTQIENLDLRIDAIEGTDVDFTGYATETYVNNAINAITIPSLSGYATETYVNNAVAAIDLTGYATETYVNNAVSSLVDSAPSTLNTLNELAAALGDDANFSTTITNSIADKAPISNPTFTGNITVNGDIIVDEIRARSNQDLTITCGESFGSLTDASFNDEFIRLAGEQGVKVYASSDNLTSGLNRETTLIDTSGNMSLAGSITPSGAATIRDVTGQYGSLEIDGAATGGWEGYSIGGWSVFMSQGTASGIYNDVNNQWIIYGTHNAATDIRYAGSAKLTTRSDGATVSGNLYFNSGYGSDAIAYGVRAWVKHTGGVTVQASGGLTSMTYHGVGDYTYNFNFTMPDSNYAAVASGYGDVAGYHTQPFFGYIRNNYTTTSFSVGWFNASNSGQRANASRGHVIVTR